MPDHLAVAEGPNSILDRAWIPYLMRLGPRPDQADQFREHPALAQSVATARFTNPAS